MPCPAAKRSLLRLPPLGPAVALPRPSNTLSLHRWGSRTAGLNQRIEPPPATHLLNIMSTPTKALHHPVALNEADCNHPCREQIHKEPERERKRGSCVKHLGSSRLVGLHTHSTTRPAAGLSGSSHKQTNSFRTCMAPLETHPTSSHSSCWFSDTWSPSNKCGCRQASTSRRRGCSTPVRNTLSVNQRLSRLHRKAPCDPRHHLRSAPKKRSYKYKNSMDETPPPTVTSLRSTPGSLST